jgi:hypothetical protein
MLLCLGQVDKYPSLDLWTLARRREKRDETHLDPLFWIQDQHPTNQIPHIRIKIRWHVIPSDLDFLQ